MDYEEIAGQWLALAQRNASGAANSCGDMLKGEGRVLCLLLDADEPLVAGDIRRQTGITSGRVANLLKQLDAKGYVQRQHDPDDRRKTVVSLTDAGRQRARAIERENVQAEAHVLEALGPQDSRELVRLFGKYLDVKESSKKSD